MIIAPDLESPATDDPRHALAAEPLSVVLIRLSLSPGQRLSIADLMEGLGDRSFGGALLALALPATVLPPLASAVLGAPLLLISTQLLIQRARPWLPARLGSLSLDQAQASVVLDRSARAVARLEAASRPRLAALFHPWHARLVAIGCMALSVVLILPAPIAHTAAGLGIGAFAAGLAQRDGLALLAGWLLTIACGGVLALLVSGVLLGLGHLR